MSLMWMTCDMIKATHKINITLLPTLTKKHKHSQVADVCVLDIEVEVLKHWMVEIDH